MSTVPIIEAVGNIGLGNGLTDLFINAPSIAHLNNIELSHFALSSYNSYFHQRTFDKFAVFVININIQ